VPMSTVSVIVSGVIFFGRDGRDGDNYIVLAGSVIVSGVIFIGRDGRDGDNYIVLAGTVIVSGVRIYGRDGRDGDNHIVLACSVIVSGVRIYGRGGFRRFRLPILCLFGDFFRRVFEISLRRLFLLAADAQGGDH
jgi:hypothetical protein